MRNLDFELSLKYRYQLVSNFLFLQWLSVIPLELETFDSVMDISFSKPQKCAVKVPNGRILVNARWNRSTVGDELKAFSGKLEVKHILLFDYCRFGGTLILYLCSVSRLYCGLQ